MTLLATRMSSVRQSVPMAVFKEMQELAAKGVDIVNLAMGEPDFETPPHVIEAAHRAALSGDTRYGSSLGAPALRAAIREKFRRDNGLDIPVANIIVANGAKQILFNAFLATVNAGDEVVIPAPHYMTYPEIVRLCGGAPVSPVCDIDTEFRLTPEVLEAAITPRTKWLVLNMPGNPSGAMYSVEELEALGQVLDRHPHVHVISDEIYEHIVFDGQQFVSFLEACPHLEDRTLIVNGVSKTYGMTGWRVGYGAGPASLVQAMETVQGQSVLSVCSIAQAAAEAALSGPQDFIKPQSEAYQARRDFILERLEDIDGLTLVSPGGAFYAFIGCHDLIGKTTPEGVTLTYDSAVARYFLEQGVASVPGMAYGTSAFLRISFATTPEQCALAMDRFALAVARL